MLSSKVGEKQKLTIEKEKVKEYRRGDENVSADTFSRVKSSAVSSNTLAALHDALCTPELNVCMRFCMRLLTMLRK